MRATLCALAMPLAGCGTVATEPLPVPSEVPDAPAVVTEVYRGALVNVAPVMFGGSPFCSYTIELRDLEFSLDVELPDQIVGAHVQNLNFESAVQPCTNQPAPPSIADYVFKSATPTDTGILVALAPVRGNKPRGTLDLLVTRDGTAFTAAFEFHRTDQDPPLDWRVTGSVTLSRE